MAQEKQSLKEKNCDVQSSLYLHMGVKHFNFLCDLVSTFFNERICLVLKILYLEEEPPCCLNICLNILFKKAKKITVCCYRKLIIQLKAYKKLDAR